MATIRWYLVNGVDANGWQQLSETAQAAATCNAGWVVSTGSTSNSELQANTERAATTFVGTGPPDGTLDTSIKDAFRTPILNGTFTSANWSFQFAVQSPTQGGAADGQIVFRMIKANADGSSATEITSAQQPASLCSNVSTSDVNGVLTINPGSITLTNQYLFIQVAWKRTGAGGMTTTNIRLRTGASTSVGTWILSSDFTPAAQSVTTNLISSTVVLYAPYLAGGPVPLPIAYWPFDEATGTTIADKSGNGHTATFQQALWRTLAQKFGASAIGWAGVPGVIANFTAINLGTVHSIAFWVSEYVTTNPGLIMGGAIDNEAPYFNDTILAYSTPGTGGPFFTTLNHGGLTGVHHIVVTRSGVSVRFYKDGVSLGTPTDLANGTNAVTVDTIGGANYSPDATAQITIDELRLYNVALTPAEVFWLYNTTVINGPTPVASTSQLFIPTVARAPLAVTTAFIPSSQELRVVDTFDMVSIGPYLAPVGIFPPTVFGFPAQPVTGVHIPSTLSLLLPAVYFPGTLPDPIAYWPFDENTGTIAIDQTGNGHTATIQQAVWDAFRRKFGASALGWLGTAGVMADITPINIGTVHTVTVWINGYTTANPGVILGGGTDTEILYISSTLFGYLTPGGYFTTIAHGDLSDGLHHLAVTRNGAVVRFYVDGVSLGTPTDLANGTVAQIVDTIGGVSFSPDATAQLTMDDLRIYGSAFTAEQILRLYNTQVLSGPTRVSELTFYGPTVANAAGSTSVTGVTISSGNQRFAPTVTVGAVTVVGGTIAVASQVFAPSTVTPGAVTIVGGTIATGNQRFAPTIATGPVTVTLGTISAASQVFAPSPITPGAVTVTNGTRAATSQVFAPSLTAIATGATITSGSVVFAPAVSYAVSLGTRATTSQVFAPTLAYGLINGTVGVGSNAQFFAPSITVGAVTVVGGTRASTLQIFAPTVTTGPVAVVGGTITTTLQTFSPTVAVGVVTVVGGTVVSTLQMFQPSVTALAAGSLGGQNISTTVVMSPPTVALAVFFVTGATISSTAVLQAPSVALGITAGHRASTAALTPPSVLAISAVTGGTRLSSVQLNAPSVTTLTFVTGATISAGTTLLPPFMVSVVLTGATITTTVQLFAPTVSPAQFVTGAFISPGQVFAPSVSTLTAVTGGTRPSGLVLFSPTVQVISVITTPGRSSTIQVFAPTLAPIVFGAFIGSTAQVFAPTIPSGVVGMSIGSTAQLFAPSVAISVVGATIGSTGQLFAPTLAPRVVGAFISATSQAIAPAFVGGALLGASIPSTLQVFAPVTVFPQVTLGVISSTAILFAPGIAPIVGGLTSTAQLFPPAVSRFTHSTCVVSQTTVRYLVTSVTLECATAAVSLVSVRYLVSSDGVHVCCGDERVTCELC